MIPPPMKVLTLVWASWTAGTIVVGAVTRLGGEVGAGHFKVVWTVSAGLAAVLALAHPAAWALAAACVLAFSAIYVRRDAFAGAIAAVTGVAVLVAVARPLAFAFASALFLGSVTNAMLLGHWHLNQPRLGTGPLLRLVWTLWAGVGVFAAASAELLTRALRGAVDAAVLGALTALAFAAFAAVLTAMVTHLVRGRSIMSATGILYLEVLLCFVAAFTGALGALAL